MQARIPSVKTLARVFDDRAKEARAILEMSRRELDKLPAGIDRNRECYNRPKTYDVRLHCLEAISPYLLESFERRDGTFVVYLNTGEIYDVTLIYDGKYKVVCLSDYIERNC